MAISVRLACLVCFLGVLSQSLGRAFAVEKPYWLTNAEEAKRNGGAELDLNGHQIGGDGVAKLVPVLQGWSSLTVLNLNGNSIGDEGAAALAKGLPASLTTLDLGLNRIGAEGAAAIA